jgi:uncharacterized membrane protein YkoI
MKIANSIAAIVIGLAAATTLQAQVTPVQVKEAKAGLLAQATVAPDSAQRLALGRVPGGEITQAELNEENGKLVYSFDIKVAGQDATKEILVDAKSGAVMAGDNRESEGAMGAGIKEGEPGLLAEATIQPDSAERIALGHVPGGSITSREIGRKEGKVVYSFGINVEGKPETQWVLVDAKTGEVAKAEHKDKNY